MTANLQQVEVNASNIVHLRDKDIIYITREMRKGSYNTAEMLGKIPGMEYDRVTEELQYQGQTKVLLLVDSLQYEESYIKKLHHIRFDKIEIIPNPQGKYSGYDVIINLCRKEKYQGYDYQGHAFSGLFPGDRKILDRSLGRGEWNQIFTYTYNKWNFFASYGGNFSQEGVNNLSTKQYLLNNYTEEVIENADGTRNYKWHERNNFLTTAIDYQFDKHNSLSVTYEYMHSDKDVSRPKTLIRTDLDGTPEDTIGSNSFSTDRWSLHKVAGFYRGQIKAWNYTASLNYNTLESNTGYDIQKTSGYQNTDNRWSKMRQTLAKAEVNRRFLKNKIYWSFGYDNFWKSYIQKRAETREDLSNYALKQSTVWTFGSYNVTNKASLSALASLTTNKTKGDQAKDRYLSWSGKLTYYQRMEHNQWLRVNYSCGVSNPDLTQVTSYGQFSDSLTWSGGNPQLRSSVSHKASLQYYFLKCLTLTLTDSYNPRTFTDITTLEYGELQSGQEGYYAATMPQNAKWNSVEASINFSKHIKSLTIAANVSCWRSKGEYESFKHSTNGYQYKAWVQYDIKKWDLIPLIHYSSGNTFGISAQGYKKEVSDALRVQLNKYFFHGKAEIMCLYILPVHFLSPKSISSWETPATVSRFIYNNPNNQISHHVEFAFTYHLTGGKSVRQYNREMSEEK
ncbi:MAG: outer membrane beta-barrel protein [Prevotellaceae bacterium]|nr:outer membrane beta-barrel protein [Prevotellaceae bacterium]